jgi:hypothetical protein
MYCLRKDNFRIVLNISYVQILRHIACVSRVTKMVELMGVEPTTSSMPRKRSPTELQPHLNFALIVSQNFNYCKKFRKCFERLCYSFGMNLF